MASATGKYVLLDDHFKAVALKEGDLRSPPVHVDKTPSEKEKVEKIAAARLVRASTARVSTRPGARGKMNEIRSILNFTGSFATTAATDYANNLNINPSLSTEYTSFSNIWDEMIVDSGKLEWTCQATTTFTTNNGAARAVVCFDPLDATVLGSLSNGLQHSQHKQFVTSTAIYQTFPLPENKDGYWTFRWKTPKGVARTTNSSVVFGHEWCSTSDTTDVYGYLKWFIPTGGATGVWTVHYTWTLNCRFRCRT